MNYKSKSIRSFIGAKDFEESRQFYTELGFSEIPISHNMVVFKVNEDLAFYLQKAYVKDWIDNSMLFLEVEDLDACFEDVKARNLTEKYDKVRLSEIQVLEWGREFFLHDPSGILWHFGSFNS
ncbi:VOC family protein [Portibacter lacus]|uniref:Glyoxalase n=1 Tax=Portibacter lacus TaxID=1099794 RepID=A0AA37SLX1_9BACT|nr:VOC family protein [Portibacter lacus]GLR16958.1 glyoxalase [Portibacter lacus]